MKRSERREKRGVEEVKVRVVCLVGEVNCWYK